MKVCSTVVIQVTFVEVLQVMLSGGMGFAKVKPCDLLAVQLGSRKALGNISNRRHRLGLCGC